MKTISQMLSDGQVDLIAKIGELTAQNKMLAEALKEIQHLSREDEAAYGGVMREVICIDNARKIRTIVTRALKDIDKRAG